MLDWHYVFWDLYRLVIAAVISGAIGFEREAHGQAAGLRTYILVGVGACLMMMLSLEMVVLHRHLSAQSVVRLDPARIASYAIAGMGFLGAGAIITGKGTVRGLTTAAALWLVTAVGLAIGAGYLIPAIIATLVSLVILYGLRQLKPVLMLRDEHTILTLKYDGHAKPLPRIRKILSDHQMAIHFINYISGKRYHLPPATAKQRRPALGQRGQTYLGDTGVEGNRLAGGRGSLAGPNHAC